jgi:prepilin-type N-terminal cleavage/methylation domain-containing protein
VARRWRTLPAASLFFRQLVLSVMTQRRRRGLKGLEGFTLVEAMVGVAIAAILAFGYYATIGSKSATSVAADRAERAANAAISLFELANAIAAIETTNPPSSFLQQVGAYPSALSQLTIPITITDRNSCDRAGDVYLTGAVPAPPVEPGYVNGWKGPYFILAFVAGANTQLASGFTVQDDMVRLPASPVTNPKGDEWAGQLQIRLPSVTQLDAQALDAAVDLTISGTSGTVRYTASDPTVVNYELRVHGC